MRIAHIDIGDPIEIAGSIMPGSSAHWFGWLEFIDEDGSLWVRPEQFSYHVIQFKPQDIAAVFRAITGGGFLSRVWCERHLWPECG